MIQLWYCAYKRARNRVHLLSPFLIIPCQRRYLRSPQNEPPVDRLSKTIDTAGSRYCSELVSGVFDSNVPTSFKFGLCFLLSTGRGTNTLSHYSAQWDVQDQELSTIHIDLDSSPPHTLSHSQAATPSPSSTLQDSKPIPPEHLFHEPKVTDNNSLPRRANATLMILARNSDIDGVIQSMEQVESRFNRKFKYPWVFLNEVEFSAEFKRRISVLTDVPVSFGVIPHDHWFQPDWIDEDRAREGRDRLVRQNIIYGGSVSYRNMCRFNSGYFFRHELLQPYKWYWRVEPDVKYFCDVDYDPFLFLEDNNKVYGFTISMPDWEPTIPTLWSSIREFVAENPRYLHPDNSMDFLSDDSGETYNLCHCGWIFSGRDKTHSPCQAVWSNFEIANLDFWRSEAYMKYFEFLENKGGFYYEVRLLHTGLSAKMMTPVRYVLLVLGIIVGLHYILSFTHEEYGKVTSVSRLTDYISGPASPHREAVPDQYYKPPEPVYSPDRKANATFVMLVRNSDLPGIMSSMKQVEDRFNRKFNYPYVIFNDEPFTEDFKKRISALTRAEVEFGLIPKEHWVQPPSIDEEKATAARENMVKEKVIYGGAYRNMCRFNSGFFYRQELLQKYRYYWRVEPDVKIFCDVDYDPFLLMEDQQKVYGFTISLFEYPATIPTLWHHVKAFINENPGLVPADNAMTFLSDDGGESYNRCHFWSNFEIADMDFWREEAYSKFFDYLDEQGGFYYEVQRFSRGRTSFTFSTILGIVTSPSNIAPKETCTRNPDVGVTQLKISVTATLAFMYLPLFPVDFT
ncbi:glycolipid 2-alpha-mannosyltransferase-domain-containing protein [Butyriboletus roseoflavus]|nr:glycolipid 2-alpha-mannosyltransferase-domain-containing protein [Butyriboletus roseoflavus]